MWILRLIPSYLIADHIMVDAYLIELSEDRANSKGLGADISADPWAFENGYADSSSCVVHFIVWTLFLILIESGIF
jgi:hypothetical protein